MEDFIAKFQLLKQELISSSNIQITNSSNKDEGKGSVRDGRLGELKMEKCQTCFTSDSCSGHFGVLNLRDKILYNPMFINTLLSVLKNICYFCQTVKNPTLIKIAEEWDTTTNETRKKELKKIFNKLYLTKKIDCSNENCKNSIVNYKFITSNRKSGSRLEKKLQIPLHQVKNFLLNAHIILLQKRKM